MRSITVSVEDEVYTRARVAAAAKDTSVSALVRTYLQQLAAQETDIERMKREEREIRARITNFSVSENISREELHNRKY